MDYIAHHGIKGMKWGVRRYQNSDGTLTPEGRVHYQKIVDHPVTFQIGSHPSLLSSPVYRIRYRKRDKEINTYYDALDKINGDTKIDLGEHEDVIRKMAKKNGISIKQAKQMADYAMEDYNRCKNTEVFKKYPHDEKTFGHPIEAGGYASKALQNDIESKSGDWYLSEPVSDRFAKALKQYHNGGGRKVVLNAVLKDLGIKVSEENRYAIENHVFWD